MTVQFDIAVFAANEGATIQSCIEALDRASGGYTARIAVLLNGTTDNSVQILRSLRVSHAMLQVYFFTVADKSNAINEFIYSLRDRSADIHFFVDGYVTVTAGALRAIAEAMAADKHAYLATGVPLNGRSAKAVADGIRQGTGNVRGNLFAMRPEFASRLVAQRVRLPVGLYRGDGLLEAMAKHDLLRPRKSGWDNKRVAGVWGGTYTLRPLSPFRWRDIRRQYRREVRIALGRIENEVLKELIYEKGFSALPSDSRHLLTEWLERQPRSRLGLVRGGFFANRAVRQGMARPPIRACRPELILQREPSQSSAPSM
ncbi:MAG: glycosyltransferase family A protein [Alphaproteobacteria bacterium]